MTEGLFKMYSISQVAELFGVSDNTIRNWEKEFSEILNIQRDGTNARYFLETDIQKLKRIDYLRSEGFGIAQIKQIFRVMQMEGEANYNDSGVSKEDFNTLKELLTTSPSLTPESSVNKEDLNLLQQSLKEESEKFQKNMVEAIAKQFDLSFNQIANMMNNLSLKIQELDKRTQLLLETPKNEDNNSIHSDFEEIKGMYNQLNKAFQSSEVISDEQKELISQQSQLIENLKESLEESMEKREEELKIKEQQFQEMVKNFREKSQDEPKGLLSRLFSRKGNS